MKPDKPIVRRYLGDTGYPAKQQELISKAVNNAAPAAFVERLRNLPKDAEFSGPDEVAEALERQDESYEEHRPGRAEAASDRTRRGPSDGCGLSSVPVPSQGARAGRRKRGAPVLLQTPGRRQRNPRLAGGKMWRLTAD